MPARAIRRLAAAVGPEAATMSAESLVDAVILMAGLKLPEGYRDPGDPDPTPDEPDITEEEAATRRVGEAEAPAITGTTPNPLEPGPAGQ